MEKRDLKNLSMGRALSIFEDINEAIISQNKTKEEK